MAGSQVQAPARPEIWKSARAAAARLGVSRMAMARIAEANGIRRRIVPGTRTLYHADDIEALAGRMIVGGEDRRTEAASPTRARGAAR